MNGWKQAVCFACFVYVSTYAFSFLVQGFCLLERDCGSYMGVCGEIRLVTWDERRRLGYRQEEMLGRGMGSASWSANISLCRERDGDCEVVRQSCGRSEFERVQTSLRGVREVGSVLLFGRLFLESSVQR
jgi:hypothetical protein